MQIAIDGPAGAGKSTIAKLIAKDLAIVYLDTGAMYRAITFGALKAKIPFENEDEIVALTKQSTIRFEGKDVIFNDRLVTEEIRQPIVSKHTSDVACIPAVRECLVEQQRAIASGTSVIMDGRDIASVVLPNADYKFYLDASIHERALRRLKEYEIKGVEKTLAEVEDDIAKRDYNDSHRDAGPLICTADAVVIDTTGKDIPTVCAEIKSYITEA